MANSILQNAKKTSKQIAIDVAKKIAREPLEILKSAARQTTGIESGASNENQSPTQNPQDLSPDKKTPDEQKLAIQSQRLMQAYEKELADIREHKKQEKLHELQAEHIQQNQEKQEEEKRGFLSSIIPQGKKKRNMLGKPGKKGPLGPTGTTKAEVRKPPSG